MSEMRKIWWLEKEIAVRCRGEEGKRTSLVLDIYLERHVRCVQGHKGVVVEIIIIPVADIEADYEEEESKSRGKQDKKGPSTAKKRAGVFGEGLSRGGCPGCKGEIDGGVRATRDVEPGEGEPHRGSMREGRREEWERGGYSCNL